MATLKKCTTCLLEKELALFTKDKSKSDGYYSKCKSCCVIKTQSFYDKHPGYKCEQDKNYYLENKDKIIVRQNKREKIRKQEDVQFKLKKNLSRAINFNLHRNFSVKGRKSCVLYLPFTMNELKTYLESQFEHWMNWSNYGTYNSKTWNNADSTTWTWQIDHIIPHSNFAYSSMEDNSFKECWSLNNLRPLNSKQNHFDGVNRVRHLS